MRKERWRQVVADNEGLDSDDEEDVWGRKPYLYRSVQSFIISTSACLLLKIASLILNSAVERLLSVNAVVSWSGRRKLQTAREKDVKLRLMNLQEYKRPGR